MSYQRLPTKVTALFIALLSVCAVLHGAEPGGLAPIQLRCEYLIDPLGIDTAKPGLSWALQAADRGEKQSAYQILVASDNERLSKDEGDLWDTGRVASDATVQIEYAGKPLASRDRCHWKVRVWDRGGHVSAWSSPASWEVALLKPDDWKARWINDGRPQPKQDADCFQDDPAPQFRKVFVVEKPIRRARLYFSGLGYGYARLNGAAVGDRVLDPGWTNYADRVLYSTYDVTSQIVQGKNCIGLMLGNGWYNPLPLKMWDFLNLRKHLTIGRPRGIAQLEIEFADGSQQVVGTDDSWKVAGGPVVRNSLYLGEVYDARRETPGWDQAGFDETGWTPAALATEPVGRLRTEMQPPIRVTGKLKPIARTEPKPGVIIFDMGQNFAGWVRMQVSGPAGTKVKLRYGELLKPDGTLNVMTSVAGQIKKGKENRDGESPLLAYQTDTYILSGRGNEVYVPAFTWHGFRYVEITGYPGLPKMDAFEGLRLSSDVRESGEFSCSNERFNRIQKMCRWTFLSNVFSVQSDCPARERFGYGGDIVPTSDALIFNYDMAAFYTKVVRDFAETQRPNGSLTSVAPDNGFQDTDQFRNSPVAIGWQIAFPLLQEKLYQYYGDLRIVRQQYPTARRQFEYLQSQSKNYIYEHCIGDHESLDPKPTALTSTAFFYQEALLMARFAEMLDKKKDAEQYRETANRIRQAFIAKFFHADANRFDIGTQACQAFALHYNLLPPERRKAVVDVLLGEVEKKQGHLATGIFGTRYLLETLSRSGHADVAYRIADQKTFPGWGHMLEGGATTLWETWAFSDNVFSHNHPMFGSVSTWFFEDIGGIRADDDAVGFNRITIRPNVVGGLTHAEAKYNSIRGPIACRWRVESDRLQMDVTVPPNTVAAVYVPATDPASVLESGKKASESPGVRVLASPAGTAVFRVGGGRYQFEAKLVHSF